MAGYLKGNHPIRDTPMLTSMIMGMMCKFQEGGEKIFNKCACFCWILGENKESRLYFEEVVVVVSKTSKMTWHDSYWLNNIILGQSCTAFQHLEVWNLQAFQRAGDSRLGKSETKSAPFGFSAPNLHLPASRHDPVVCTCLIQGIYDMWGILPHLSFYSWGLQPYKKMNIFVHDEKTPWISGHLLTNLSQRDVLCKASENHSSGSPWFFSL